MLIPFGSNIWLSDGPEVGFAGFHYPTRMAIVRLESGGLWVWSPVALTHDLNTAVQALGTVQHIVAPNHLHHLALTDWQSAFPGAKIYAAPKLAGKRKDIAFDATLGATAPAAWAGQIDQVVVTGNLITTEVVFFHRESGTVLFTDLIQQFPREYHKGWRAVVAKLDKMVADTPTVPRKFRVAFVNRKAARSAIGQIKDWPIARLVFAHGPPMDSGAKAAVARAFDWLG